MNVVIGRTVDPVDDGHRALYRPGELDADSTEERDSGTMAWTVERAMAGWETVLDAIFDGEVGIRVRLRNETDRLRADIG